MCDLKGADLQMKEKDNFLVFELSCIIYKERFETKSLTKIKSGKLNIYLLKCSTINLQY